MTQCPPDCLERHNKNWHAICLALSGVGAAFLAIAGLYLYLTAGYARAIDVDDAKRETRELRAEIRAELKDINRKIDRLIEREARIHNGE
ncbi:MAG: hypothetical protein N3A66_04425 [Planctomycetota bacterium]|nr:hypothetical protein [Planctomycetota bacterium]